MPQHVTEALEVEVTIHPIQDGTAQNKRQQYLKNLAPAPFCRGGGDVYFLRFLRTVIHYIMGM
jgi:hypothetical protein